jgi:hypothetical protein
MKYIGYKAIMADVFLTISLICGITAVSALSLTLLAIALGLVDV